MKVALANTPVRIAQVIRMTDHPRAKTLAPLARPESPPPQRKQPESELDDKASLLALVRLNDVHQRALDNLATHSAHRLVRANANGFRKVREATSRVVKLTLDAS